MKKQAAIMVNRLAISQARVNLGQVAKRVYIGGEYFILEKDGIPVMGIMGAEELEDYLELKNPGVKSQIEGSNTDILAGRIKPASVLLAGPLAKGRRRKQK